MSDSTYTCLITIILLEPWKLETGKHKLFDFGPVEKISFQSYKTLTSLVSSSMYFSILLTNCNKPWILNSPSN